ncbi:hypothetical protein ACLB2K_038814 [Fragaria x ananassa]
MVLVANIIKLSSVSLAKMSCGTTTTTTTTTIRSVQPTAAHSGHETTNVVHSTSTNSTAASTKVLLDIEPSRRPRRSQKRPEEPAAVARNGHHQSKPAKVAADIPRQGFTAVTIPSTFLHAKRDHRQVRPDDDVDGRAEEFIRRRRQIINDVNTE